MGGRRHDQQRQNLVLDMHNMDLRQGGNKLVLEGQNVDKRRGQVPATPNLCGAQ